MTDHAEKAKGEILGRKFVLGDYACFRADPSILSQVTYF